MVENKIDTLFQKLEEDINADDKEAIVISCTKLLGYSNFLDERIQSNLFLTKGITLLKLEYYTMALLNVKRAIAINNDSSNKDAQLALECIKLKIME